MYSRWTTGPRPLDVYLQAYLPRLLMGVVFAAVVWVTPYMGSNGEFPFYYYIIILVAFGLHQVLLYIHTVCFYIHVVMVTESV